MRRIIEVIMGTPPGWRELQADVQLIKEMLMSQQDLLVRLGNSIDSVGTAVSQVADLIRNHPAAQVPVSTTDPTLTDDSAQLAAFADKLDQFATQLSSAASELTAEATGTTAAPAPAPSEPTAQSTAAAAAPASTAPAAAPAGTAQATANASSGGTEAPAPAPESTGTVDVTPTDQTGSDTSGQPTA